MAQQKDNTGYLRPNHKRDNERSPNAKGSFKVGGLEYWASAWTNTDEESGEKYISIKLSPKKPKNPAKSRTQRKLEQEDDIPF